MIVKTHASSSLAVAKEGTNINTVRQFIKVLGHLIVYDAAVELVLDKSVLVQVSVKQQTDIYYNSTCSST